MNKLLKTIMILILLMSVGSDAGTETLYVFYPSIMPTASLQKKLTEVCPGIEITVFSRFRDFEERIKTDMPDAILTKPTVIEKIDGYAFRLNGSRRENTEESYVFLSVNTPIDVSRLSNRILGVLDILGKNEMDAFVGRFLNPVPELKRVSKIDDLLLLLTFNMADAILIPEGYVRYYKEKSNLNFAVTPFPNMKTGILAMGVKQGKDAVTITKLLMGLDMQHLKVLEIDQWK